MSAWVSAAPAIGTRSLDGFAIGALISGACALAITVRLHARARRAQARRDGRAAGGYRSRHRLGDPAPVLSPGDGAAAAFPDAETFPDAEAFPDAEVTFADAEMTFADTEVMFADAEVMFADAETFPDAELTFPDAELADHELRSARRPEARRVARHAAPSVSVGRRVTGLFSTRALASGAR